MIVKNHTRRASGYSRELYFFGGIILLGLVIAGYFLVRYQWMQFLEEKEAGSVLVTCSAEQLDSVNGGLYFVNGENVFGGADGQSDDHVHSGSFSCKLNKDYPYGLTYILKDGKAGDRYKVSVWRYRSDGLRFGQAGQLVVSAPGIKLYQTQEASKVIQDDGWEKMEYRFVLPSHYAGEEVKIYAYHTLNEPVWFDDLRIEKVFRIEEAYEMALADTVLQSLDIRIKEKGMEKLQQKRAEAFRKWLLITEEDDWVKGKIGKGEEALSVKLRLKGDLLDHLKGDKWSFRIAVKAPQAWNRMLTFSVQNPVTRDYLSEWLYHRFLEQEDILATRYDFLTVSLNGNNLGVYAYEEHFEKQLLESRSRREGPIVKFTEDGMWAARRRGHRNQVRGKITEYALNQYEASDITPFKEGKTLESPVLAEQARLARSLMQDYKYGKKPVDEVFDLDRLARYYAVTDIFKAYHGLIWHNQRFYYNPVIGKLEPIGFDGFVFNGYMDWVGRPFILFALAEEDGDRQYDLINNLFFDETFVEHYLRHLWRLSDPRVMEDFLFSLDAPITKREKFIQLEVDDYRLDRQRFIGSAREIHGLILPMQETAIRAYSSSVASERTLKVTNTHPLPLRIVGFGRTAQQPDTLLPKKLFFRAYNPAAPPVFSEVSAPDDARFIYYQVPGLDTLFVTAISPWKAPEGDTPPQKLFSEGEPKSNDLYLVEGDQILFPMGKYQVSEDIVIPQGYQVRFEAGLSLDLVKGAKFVSRSPVEMLGDAERPIRIFSSDHSGQGFTVLQAEGHSRLSYVTFEHLTTLSDEGWQLTGAVTFYESDVDIHQCAFIYNHCEDALNLVRCEFEMTSSLVGYTFSDGFDADFCKGKIRNCRFIETGNDGMDFSGSVINIEQCQVENPGDKGISVGEQANVHILSAEISGARLGVASKDLSQLRIDNIVFKDCETGFAAYQKKPEYGPAKIVVNAYEAEGVKRLHLIEKGSELWLNGVAAEGI